MREQSRILLYSLDRMNENERGNKGMRQVCDTGEDRNKKIKKRVVNESERKEKRPRTRSVK